MFVATGRLSACRRYDACRVLITVADVAAAAAAASVATRQRHKKSSAHKCMYETRAYAHCMLSEYAVKNVWMSTVTSVVVFIYLQFHA